MILLGSLTCTSNESFFFRCCLTYIFTCFCFVATFVYLFCSCLLGCCFLLFFSCLSDVHLPEWSQRLCTGNWKEPQTNESLIIGHSTQSYIHPNNCKIIFTRELLETRLEGWIVFIYDRMWRHRFIYQLTILGTDKCLADYLEQMMLLFPSFCLSLLLL